jgi:hypothetical protein
VGFVVDKTALGHVSSEYFGSPVSDHSTNFSIIIITRGWQNRPLVAAVPSGPNWTHPPPYNLKKYAIILRYFEYHLFFYDLKCPSIENVSVAVKFCAVPRVELPPILGELLKQILIASLCFLTC